MSHTHISTSSSESRHAYCQPTDVHATLVSNEATMNGIRVRALCMEGMMVSRCTALRLGQPIVSRLFSNGEWLGLSGVVVQRKHGSAAIRFTTLCPATRQRLEALILRERVRATGSLILVAHRSRDQGNDIVAMLGRAGLPVAHVRTPLALMDTLAHYGEVSTTLLMDEHFFGADRAAYLCVLAELHPELETHTIVRSRRMAIPESAEDDTQLN